jgi:hypothetical protein
MAKNNDVVIINLDRPRELRFGHKALKTFQAISGVGLDEIGKGGYDLDTIEKLIYCGLLSDGRKQGDALKLENMEDILDELPLQEIIDKMTEALSVAFGADPNQKGIVTKKK